jgi:mono/diheme cytochrome c family protein
MKKLFVALLLLPLAQSTGFGPAAQAAQAPPGGQGGGGNAATLTGSAANGKMYWDSNLTACKNCHGGLAEGAFGPDLAGRGLNTVQVLRAVRQPWGIMPRFNGTQISGQQAADVAAYFASMPKVATPGQWRFEAKAGDPAGLRRLINMGCAQCHSPQFQGPRGNMGATNMSFDDFENLVYNHTTAIHQLRISRGGNANGNVDMGDYNRERVTPATLRQIYNWARDDIGFRAPMVAQISKPQMGPTGASYTVTVTNGGLQGRGIIAEGVNVSLIVPAGTNVVAANGPGYQGTHMDGGNMVATWMLPRSAPGDKADLTITLSKAGTAQDNLRGNIKWAKPGPRQGQNADVVNINPPAA